MCGRSCGQPICLRPRCQKMAQGSPRSSLTAFKTGRGLACCLSVSEIRHLFWCLVLATQQRAEWILPGPCDVAGTKALPNIGMINGARVHNYNCSTSWR